MALDQEAVWRQYEKLTEVPIPEILFGGTDGIIFKIKDKLSLPAYKVSYKPFETGAEEMNALVTLVNQIETNSVNAVNASLNVVAILSKFTDVPGLPTNLNFNITDIINDPGTSNTFTVETASTGLCGLTTSFPSTLLGATENIIPSIISGIIPSIVNFMDRVNTIFTNPNRMGDNLKIWFDKTLNSINEKIKNKRDEILAEINEIRNDIKINNNETQFDNIIEKMNKLGQLDNNIKELAVALKNLKTALVQLKISFDNASKLAMALSRNMPTIISAWQKDATCIMAKMKDLFTRTS